MFAQGLRPGLVVRVLEFRSIHDIVPWPNGAENDKKEQRASYRKQEARNNSACGVVCAAKMLEVAQR